MFHVINKFEQIFFGQYANELCIVDNQGMMQTQCFEKMEQSCNGRVWTDLDGGIFTILRGVKYYFVFRIDKEGTSIVPLGQNVPENDHDVLFSRGHTFRLYRRQSGEQMCVGNVPNQRWVVGALDDWISVMKASLNLCIDIPNFLPSGEQHNQWSTHDIDVFHVEFVVERLAWIEEWVVDDLELLFVDGLDTNPVAHRFRGHGGDGTRHEVLNTASHLEGDDDKTDSHATRPSEDSKRADNGVYRWVDAGIAAMALWRENSLGKNGHLDNFHPYPHRPPKACAGEQGRHKDAAGDLTSIADNR